MTCTHDRSPSQGASCMLTPHQLLLACLHAQLHRLSCACTGACSPGAAMQMAFPLRGLVVGQAWRQQLLCDGPGSSGIEVCVHLCHALSKVRHPCRLHALACKGQVQCW